MVITANLSGFLYNPNHRAHHIFIPAKTTTNILVDAEKGRAARQRQFQIRHSTRIQPVAQISALMRQTIVRRFISHLYW